MEWFILALISAVLSSISAIAEKKTLFKEHAMEFATILAVFSAIITFPALILFKSQITLPLMGLLYLNSLLDTFGFLLIAKAIRHLDVSVSSPMLAFGPAITAVFGFLLLKETLSVPKVGGIGLIILGAYILQINYKQLSFIESFKSMFKSKYIRYIFLALVIVSLSSIIDRFLLNTDNNFNISPVWMLAVLHIFHALNYLVLLHIYHDGVKGVVHGVRNAGWWIYLVTALVIGYRLLGLSAVSIPAAKIGLVSAITRTSVLFATVLGGEIFHESGLLHKIIACMVMIAGVYLIVI